MLDWANPHAITSSHCRRFGFFGAALPARCGTLKKPAMAKDDRLGIVRRRRSADALVSASCGTGWRPDQRGDPWDVIEPSLPLLLPINVGAVGDSPPALPPSRRVRQSTGETAFSTTACPVLRPSRFHDAVPVEPVEILSPCGRFTHHANNCRSRVSFLFRSTAHRRFSAPFRSTFVARRTRFPDYRLFSSPWATAWADIAGMFRHFRRVFRVTRPKTEAGASQESRDVGR